MNKRRRATVRQDRVSKMWQTSLWRTRRSYRREYMGNITCSTWEDALEVATNWTEYR